MENTAIYGQPTHDTMFAASRNVTDLYQNHQFWFPESFAANQEVSITACAERVQICNLGSAHDNSTVVCSELGGYLSLPTSDLVDGAEVPSNSARSLDMNQKQLATLRRLDIQLNNDWIGNSPQVLGQSSLNASTSLLVGLMDVFSQGLPIIQWHYEVLYWHKTSLAAIQKVVLTLTMGPTVSTFNQDFYSARNASNSIYYGAMCDQQKSVSPFHTSFSTFGLVLLLALGTLIIIFNLIIPRLIERIRTARDYGSRAQTCWQMDEMLQMQALGYEIANVGMWCEAKYKHESGDTADSKKGKTWKRYGISSEKYPRTVTAEQLPSLYQCTEEKCRCRSESAPSSMREVVVEVKHEENVKPAATWPLMGSEQA
ncbi:hypothetical protein LTS15_000065 [Exophiala xenobiotica]|nr:hypothetical protein LTS15_000065 [Exophiala xenobiotica]